MRLFLLIGVLLVVPLGIAGQEYWEIAMEEETALPASATIIAEFENDIFLQSDHYFTNGIGITLVNNDLKLKAIDNILRSPLTYNMKRYSIEIRQNMYTPESKYEPEIQYGDRPFSGYLILSYNKETFQKNTRFLSSLTLGVVGNYSGAGLTQNFIHSFNDMLQFEGWQHQIKNSPVINVKYEYEHLLVNTRHLALGYTMNGRLGTLYTDAYAGINLKFGIISSQFNMPENIDGLQVFGYLNSGARISVYDATLQGGIIGKVPNDYYITQAEKNIFISNISAGICIAYNKLYAKAGITLISPEFVEGKPHGWGSISVAFTF